MVHFLLLVQMVETLLLFLIQKVSALMQGIDQLAL